MSKKLANELKTIRELKKLSLRQVEKTAGITNAYLSQLERGIAKNPSPNILYELAKVYDVPYESLMEAAGYLKKADNTKSQRPTAIQAALMSSNLTDEESKMVAQYIEFLRKERNEKIK